MIGTHPEIERKFLLAGTPPGRPLRPERLIQQGYLLVDSVRQIRLRQSGPEFFFTIKDELPSGRMETEIPLSEEQFSTLWPLTEGRRLEKIRSFFSLGELVAEVDRYRGHHDGLAVVEVEFPHHRAAVEFQPPAWFGVEVTGQARYSNLMLAGCSTR